MTLDDAKAVVGILSAAYPRAAGQQTTDFYASMILRYEVEDATKAVIRLTKQSDRFPSLAVLLQAIQADHIEAIPVLDEEPTWAVEPPHWTRIHKHMRPIGDMRVIPEMIPGCIEIGQPLPPLPWDMSDGKVWLQPGEYGYIASGYEWAGDADVQRGCCFHYEDQGLPLRTVMVLGEHGAMQFRMCLRCAATYEHRRAA